MVQTRTCADGVFSVVSVMPGFWEAAEDATSGRLGSIRSMRHAIKRRKAVVLSPESLLKETAA